MNLKKKLKKIAKLMLFSSLMMTAVVVVTSEKQVDAKTWYRVTTLNDEVRESRTVVQPSIKLDDISYLGDESATIATKEDLRVRVFGQNPKTGEYEEIIKQGNSKSKKKKNHKDQDQTFELQLSENTAMMIKTNQKFRVGSQRDNEIITEIFTRALPNNTEINNRLKPLAEKFAGKEYDDIKIGLPAADIASRIYGGSLTSYHQFTSSLNLGEILKLDQELFNNYKNNITADEIKTIYSYTFNQIPYTPYLRSPDTRKYVVDVEQNRPGFIDMTKIDADTKLAFPAKANGNKDYIINRTFNPQSLVNFFNDEFHPQKGTVTDNLNISLFGIDGNGIEKQSMLLNKFVGKNQIKWTKPTTLYRGTKEPEARAIAHYNSGSPQDALDKPIAGTNMTPKDQFKAGDIICDLTFSSFSMDMTKSANTFSNEGGVLFFLEVDTGIELGAGVDPLSHYAIGSGNENHTQDAFRDYLQGNNPNYSNRPGESEILMPAATKFIVSRVQRGQTSKDWKGTRTIVYLRYQKK